ncbi:hypothetical protein Bbelb_187010 [Branchiostoma belcheri]|nr:hypothetical protein Bbelb_187010 [Branchiostoma belcheri]
MEQAMRKILDDAAGRVLLVDEIYQLGSGGNDAKKALEAIMNRAYEPRENTPIIILAGYQDHIEKEQLSEILLLKIQQSYVRCEGCGLPELKEAIMHLPREYLAHNNARVAGQITQNIKVESPAFTPGFRPSLRTGLAVSFAGIEQAVMKLKDDVSDRYAPDTEDEGTKRRTRAKKPQSMPAPDPAPSSDDEEKDGRIIYDGEDDDDKL